MGVYLSLSRGLDGEKYMPIVSLSYCYSNHPLSNSFGCDYPSQGETTKVILVIIRLLNRHQLKLSRLSFQTTKCHPEPKCVILSQMCHPERSEGSRPCLR